MSVPITYPFFPTPEFGAMALDSSDALEAVVFIFTRAGNTWTLDSSWGGPTVGTLAFAPVSGTATVTDAKTPFTIMNTATAYLHSGQIDVSPDACATGRAFSGEFSSAFG